MADPKLKRKLHLQKEHSINAALADKITRIMHEIRRERRIFREKRD